MNDQTAKNTNDTGVQAYYDSISDQYSMQYENTDLTSAKKYPQNYFRLQWILSRLSQLQLQSVYEVGTGEGTPLSMMHKMGFRVAGCDISSKMVEITKKKLSEAGVPKPNVQYADIEDCISFANQVSGDKFDSLIAMGVMPHVKNDELTLQNMRMFLKPGGKLFVEFRNKMFSMFTFNRLTKEFVLDDLLPNVADDVKGWVAEELDKRVDVNLPPVRAAVENQSVSYDKILAKFHVHFEVEPLLKQCGYKNIKFHWYHYHPAPPMLEQKDKVRFWQEAAKMEHNYSDTWRGMFLCSAFMVEAQVEDEE